MEASAQAIEQRYEALSPVLHERGLRLFAATEARAYGYGGVSVVARITGMARSTIERGMREMETKSPMAAGRSRRPGGGRKAKRSQDATLLPDLQRLVEPATRGDPMRTLRWTSKSLRHLAQALQERGHSVCPHVIADCLRELGYSLQANSKTREGGNHMDRDAQFHYLNDQATAFLAAGEPVISVDTKKKELVGNFKNQGREYRPKATPEAVKVHDFIDPALGRAVPYGVYDIADNKGWVSVGTDHDTASFAVHAIQRWWHTLGQTRYPKASRLMITADGGGSNGSRVRLFKVELQPLADETGLTLQVCHFPPGTSKWNKIEHRLFCHITQTWRGQPLTSRLAVVDLIAATTTKTGLQVRCELDTRAYPKGIKVSDAEMDTLNIQGDAFHPEWNYTIAPRLLP